MLRYYLVFFIFFCFVIFISCAPDDFLRKDFRTVVIQDIPLIEFPFIDIKQIKGTSAEIEEIKSGVFLLNTVFASQCFEREVLTGEFTETNDLNNQEIYNVFRSEITRLSIIMYMGSWTENYIWKTVGYIRQNIPDTVFQNRYFVKTEVDIARNLIHEIAHLKGFNHYAVFASSVPYQMNHIWDVCAKELGIIDQSP